MDRSKCERCGREVRLLAEGAIAYWCRDCKKLYPVAEPKVRKRKKKEEPVVKTEAIGKLDIPIVLG